MPNNSVKRIQANKIRKLNIQTNNIGIIYETDIDFGDIEKIPVTKCTPNDETYIKEHLNSDQKQAVIDLLIKNQAIISETLKIARIGEHSIKLIENSKSKMKRPYRIPETLKEEVGRQIDDLLTLG
ncbi:hypothetical protein NPIL_22111 [Nephila pilipes]|uniref:Uncharacterized protein n=1 Tax=Nephila pilipes TaxID=299642 RepID=A0A8X6THQ0_NEPPI|nr:hypothetical protein NPIL_22111 [Nephila pilipes]